MRASTIGFGTFIDGKRVVGVGYLVEAGKRKRVFTLAGGGRRVAALDGWVESARPGRRDLSAGPVRASTMTEMKASIRDSQGRRKGDEGGMSLASRRSA